MSNTEQQPAPASPAPTDTPTAPPSQPAPNVEPPALPPPDMNLMETEFKGLPLGDFERRS